MPKTPQAKRVKTEPYPAPGNSSPTTSQDDDQGGKQDTGGSARQWTGAERQLLIDFVVKHGAPGGINGWNDAVPGRTGNQSRSAWRYVLYAPLDGETARTTSCANGIEICFPSSSKPPCDGPRSIHQVYAEDIGERSCIAPPGRADKADDLSRWHGSDHAWLRSLRHTSSHDQAPVLPLVRSSHDRLYVQAQRSCMTFRWYRKVRSSPLIYISTSTSPVFRDLLNVAS